MNSKFHGDIILQLAKWSGYSDEDSLKISYASFMVDQNVRNFDIEICEFGNELGNKSYGIETYRNWRSQFALEDLFEAKQRTDILSTFHFIPGLSEKPAGRKDGKENRWSVIAGSKLANQILDEALYTKDLNRIGIALHSFSDSYSHQNFSAKWEEWNCVWSNIAPNFAHNEVGNAPDELSIWCDLRYGDFSQKTHTAKYWIECCLSIIQKLNIEITEREFGYYVNDIFDLVFDNTPSTFINRWDTKEKIEADFENWKAFQESVKQHKNYCLELFKQNNL